MKIKLDYFAYFVILLIAISCQKKTTIYDVLECKSSNSFAHAKTLRDVQNHFEINIGENWKRELYYDSYQSRIYAADTTRSYSSSFIVDITRFEGKIIIEKAFQEQLMKTIKEKKNQFIIKEGFIDFKEQKSYTIFSFQKREEQQTYTLECYVPSGEFYYLLTSTINGSDNLANNILESLQVFNSLKILP